MNKAGGFITLHRKIIGWEWYKNINTKVLFLHLLLTANYENSRFMGKTIKRGQVVTSLPALAAGTCLSIRQVRTALDHLILTGEVTNKSTNQYRLITIVKYDDYQSMTGNVTGKRQAIDRQIDSQMTDELTPSNNNNKNNKKNNKTNKPPKGFTAPSPDEVRTYCQSVGLVIDADRFCDFYGSNGWRVGKNAMKDWRAAARNWARRDRADKPTKPANQATNYSQRDYLSETEAALERMMSGEGF